MGSFFKLLVIVAVGGYAATGLMGWDFGTSEKRPSPTGVRQSPGGNRSFHFWHTGFHGGK